VLNDVQPRASADHDASRVSKTPSAQGQVVVGCAADARYVIPLAAMLESVVSNLDPRRSLQVYVLDGGLSEADRRRLTDSWPSSRVSLEWITPASDGIADLPLWGRMPITTYQRLWIARLLPPHVHKLIWLDCDLIVRGDLSGMWDIDLVEHHILAVQDMVVPYVSSRHGLAGYRDLGFAPDTKYFNAGVMVVNLDAWREDRIGERVVAYLRDHRREVVFWDQQGLNAVLAGKWGELDPRWNQIAGVSGRAFFRISHLPSEVYQEVLRDPWIIHFGGTLKPWLYHNANPSRALFFEYLDRTAWAAWRPRRTFKSLLMGVYDSVLRDFLYPAEKWLIELQRRRRRGSRA
jgi:lipopolysaccharide biosynthesis glycosyltransferase